MLPGRDGRKVLRRIRFASQVPVITKPQTEFTLSLEVVGDNSDSARILVADHGDGVPPEALDRIFEPFYRATEAREHQTGGIGLGLSIAQRIAIVHGGTIRAQNRDGGGLEIVILLPVSTSKPRADLDDLSSTKTPPLVRF